MTETGVKRFGGKSREPIKFFADDDLFYAAPRIPSDSMMDIIDKYSQINENSTQDIRKAYQAAIEMFEMVLLDDSFTLMKQRLSDKSNPVEITDVIEIIQWLLGEAYAIRPTQSSSPSIEQPASDGTSSMDGTPAIASTTTPSPGTDSSTSSTTG